METQTLEGWLDQRKIDPELAIGKLGITLQQTNGQPAIVFPFIQGGKTVNNKYRTFDKQFRQDKDAVKCFYNYDVIQDPTLAEHPLIITEGEVDALTFIQAGYPKTVSVPDGAPNETHDEVTAKYSYLEDEVATIRSNCPFVILATDKDTNGDNLLYDLSLRLGKDFCKFLKYPKGCKDANEALVKYGDAVVSQIIDTQQWLDIDGVFKPSDLPPVATANVYDIDLNGFNDHMKIRLGDFSVVTGIPGMGKSTFVNDVLCRVANKHNLKIAFASFEQHPSLDHMRNLRRWFKGTYPQTNQYQADEWINKHFCFVYPSDKQQLEEKIDLDWFLEKASTAVIQHGCQVIVVDPWNELEHSPGRNTTMTEYVGRSIKRLKHFAKSNNVHVMVVAHPAKMLRNRSDGKYPIPSLYDISDSAHWANKADLGIVVHRETYDSNETIVFNKKSRYHDQIGRPGQAKFQFLKHTNRFEWIDMDE